MTDNLALLEVDDRVATITINRPDKRNALSPELIAALKFAFAEANKREDVKVIILKANGNVFSAGADLAYMEKLAQFTYAENIEDTTSLKDLFEQIRTLPKVVIAQVEGHAIAGGCGLATICDIIFAVPEAKFGYTEVKLGFVPALVSCYLIQKVGETVAKKLLLTGDLITANEALQYNLITYVTDHAEISQTVNTFAQNLCHGSSANSLALTKQLINQTSTNWLEFCLNNAITINAKTRQSQDFKFGIGKFLTKEEIKW
jgi:methylglutaconyl-CoA hydratase